MKAADLNGNANFHAMHLDEFTKAEELDKFIKAEEMDDNGEGRQSLSLPLVGKGRAAEGGANFQVNQSPSTCTTSTRTNPCFACTPTEPSKAANLTLISVKTNVSLRKELNKTMNLLVTIIKTRGNPGGKQMKPCNSVLPLMSDFRMKSEF